MQKQTETLTCQTQTCQTQLPSTNQESEHLSPTYQTKVHIDEKESEHMKNAQQTVANHTDETSALSDLVVTNSQELMKGQSQIAIAHQGDTYFLRVTKQGKLILTK